MTCDSSSASTRLDSAIEELTAAGIPRVVAVTPLGSLAERIGIVSATIEAGNALLPLGVPWLVATGERGYQFHRDHR